MQRRLLLIPLMILLLVQVIGGSFYAVSAGIGAEVVVDGADSTWRSAITASAGLADNLVSIQPSLMTQFANAALHYHLSVIPPGLQAQINGLVLPVASEFADAVTQEHLITVPENLHALLAGVLPAFETQFANSSSYSALRFPQALMADTTAPTIDNINAQSSLADTLLTWHTDEFTSCTVGYGLQLGDYGQTTHDALYYQKHHRRLGQLIQGATYFVQFVCTDQSGNPATNTAFSFLARKEQQIWLPLVQR